MASLSKSFVKPSTEGFIISLMRSITISDVSQDPPDIKIAYAYIKNTKLLNVKIIIEYNITVGIMFKNNTL